MVKLLVGLVVSGGLVLSAFVIGVPILASDGSSDRPAISHELLEADRRMTEQMVVSVGPGMEAQMRSNGMLERSSDPAYVDALERHVYDFERMLGRVP